MPEVSSRNRDHSEGWRVRPGGSPEGRMGWQPAARKSREGPGLNPEGRVSGVGGGCRVGLQTGCCIVTGSLGAGGGEKGPERLPGGNPTDWARRLAGGQRGR